MVLPATASLSYSTPLGGPVADTTKQALMSVVPLYNPGALPCNTDPVLSTVYGGSSVIADVTAPSGGLMVRTLTILLGTSFFQLFPTVADWENAFNSLYDRTLSLALSAPVTSNPVTFA